MLPDYSVIGRRIKNARLEQKMKQEDIADEMDVSIAYLSRVEGGKTKINLKRLTQIAEILNLTPSYLLTGCDYKSKDYLKEDFKQILEKCTPEQQKLIYQISELISKTNVVNEKSLEQNKK